MARRIDPTKRTAILLAGRTILLRDGYAAAKMSDIAAEAGVAPGTLYLYFESKDDLAGAIGEDFFGSLGQNFAQLFKKLDKAGGINELVEFALRIGTEERDLLALLKQSTPPHEHDENSPRMQFRARLAAVLAELMKNEKVRQYEPFSLADMIMTILHGLMIHCCLSESINQTQLKSSAVKLIQHALFEDCIVGEKTLKHKSVPVNTRLNNRLTKV
jgi:AcrR family transcriptional regulator